MSNENDTEKELERKKKKEEIEERMKKENEREKANLLIELIIYHFLHLVQIQKLNHYVLNVLLFLILD